MIKIIFFGSKMSILIHSKANCKYCDLTKEFFESKNIIYNTIHYDPIQEQYDDRKKELMTKTNHYTFPQIFVDHLFIGGYTELMIAYDTGRLQQLCNLEMEYDF